MKKKINTQIKKINEMDKDFQKLNQEFKNYEKTRNIILDKSREIIKKSKQIIYTVHRSNIPEAKKLIKNVEIELLTLNKKFNVNKLISYNLYKGSLQEYVEARTFLDFILIGKISTSSKLKINYHDYLCGLADLTGELGRYAVMSATKNDFKKVIEIKEFVDYILGKFLKFDFSNGELRKKYDAIKWNLNKIEGIVYDYSLRKK